MPTRHVRGPERVDYNWLTPKAEARPAGDKGWGSFAIEPIEGAETMIAVWQHLAERDHSVVPAVEQDVCQRELEHRISGLALADP